MTTVLPDQHSLPTPLSSRAGSTSMSIRVHLSALLSDHSGAPAELVLAATSVRAALAELERSHAKVYRSVCDETGALRRHVNLFVNSSSVRDLAGLDTPLRPGDELTLIQAVSGG